MTFLAADGVAPSNEGRGYVMRRVIRRAVLQAGRIGLEPPFLAGSPTSSSSRWATRIRSCGRRASEIERVLSDEEERFSETLARGLTLFEEVAAAGEISGDEAFRLHDTYGFPLELTQELARERGLPVDEDGFRELMEEQRARSRKTGPAEVDVRVCGRGAQRVRRLREDRGADGDRRLRGSRRRALPGEARAVAVLPGGRRPGLRRGLHRERGDRRAGRAGRGDAAARRRPGADLRGRGLRATGCACGRSCRGRCASRRWRTTPRRTSCTRRCRRCSASTCGRPARRCGRTSCASTSAHPQAAHGGGARRGRAARQRGVFENLPVRAYIVPIEEARRLGAMMLFGEKYGDEVRRGRHRRLLARALRRHARALDRGDRAVRDHLRELGRLGHAPHRGGHLRRGLRAAARARGRGGRAARRARAGAQGRAARRRSRSTCRSSRRSEEEIGGVNVFVGRASGVDVDALLDESDRIKQERAPAAVVLGVGRGRPRAPRRQLRPLARGAARRGRGDQGGRGRGRRRRRRAADDGPRRRARPGEARRRARQGGGGAAPARSREGGCTRLRLGAHRRRRLRSDRHDRAAARRGRARRDRGRARAARRARARRGRRARRRRPAADAARRARRAGAETEAFVEALRAALDVPVESYDERFTTGLAASAGSDEAPRTRAPPPTCCRATSSGRAPAGSDAAAARGRRGATPRSVV